MNRIHLHAFPLPRFEAFQESAPSAGSGVGTGRDAFRPGDSFMEQGIEGRHGDQRQKAEGAKFFIGKTGGPVHPGVMHCGLTIFFA
ncbi:MAG TPA: hypothetical protein PK750_12040, partial [Syntrophales bacterium]|nr:hypothetical protein [Syntrophales bacterium]